MIAVDTNLLVYTHREDTEWHLKAEETVRALAEGVAAWATRGRAFTSFSPS